MTRNTEPELYNEEYNPDAHVGYCPDCLRDYGHGHHCCACDDDIEEEEEE